MKLYVYERKFSIKSKVSKLSLNHNLFNTNLGFFHNILYKYYVTSIVKIKKKLTQTSVVA